MFKFIQLKQVINALVPMDQKIFSQERPDVDILTSDPLAPQNGHTNLLEI